VQLLSSKRSPAVACEAKTSLPLEHQDAIDKFLGILRATTQVCHCQIYSRQLIQLYNDEIGNNKVQLTNSQRRTTRRKLQEFHRLQEKERQGSGGQTDVSALNPKFMQI